MPFSLFSHPGYFGKRGFRVYHLNKHARYCPAISTENLWKLLGEDVRKEYMNRADKKVPVLDCRKHVCILLTLRHGITVSTLVDNYNWFYNYCGSVLYTLLCADPSDHHDSSQSATFYAQCFLWSLLEDKEITING